MIPDLNVTMSPEADAALDELIERFGSPLTPIVWDALAHYAEATRVHQTL